MKRVTRPGSDRGRRVEPAMGPVIRKESGEEISHGLGDRRQRACHIEDESHTRKEFVIHQLEHAFRALRLDHRNPSARECRSRDGLPMGLAFEGGRKGTFGLGQGAGQGIRDRDDSDDRGDFDQLFRAHSGIGHLLEPALAEAPRVGRDAMNGVDREVGQNGVALVVPARDGIR